MGTENQRADLPAPTKVMGINSVFSKVWAVAEDRAIAIIAEIMLASILLFGLFVFFLFTRLLRAVGYSPDRMNWMESIDYWGVLIVFANYVWRFVFQAVSITWRVK